MGGRQPRESGLLELADVGLSGGRKAGVLGLAEVGERGGRGGREGGAVSAPAAPRFAGGGAGARWLEGRLEPVSSPQAAFCTDVTVPHGAEGHDGVFVCFFLLHIAHLVKISLMDLITLICLIKTCRRNSSSWRMLPVL